MRLSIRSKVMISAASLFLVSGATFAVTAHFVVRKMMGRQTEGAIVAFEEGLRKQQRMIRGSYSRLVEGIEQKALEEAAMMSCLPEVAGAYRVALSGDIDDESDARGQEAREILRRTCAPYLKGHKAFSGTGALQLHYHLPNGHSLARLWREGWQTKRDGRKVDISDDITSFRPTITLVNTTNKPVSGIEVGSGGLVIRGLCPVLSEDGKHLGSNEVISPFTPIVQALQTSSEEQFAVLMDNRLLGIAVLLQDSAAYPQIGTDYVLAAATDITTAASLLRENQEVLAEALETEFSRLLGSTYLATFPIHDFEENAVGVFVSMLDVSAQQQALAKQERDIKSALFHLQRNIATGTVVAVLVICGIMWFISGSISRDIMESVGRLRDVAEGVASASLHISTASRQLAEGATEQASSLEESSSALEQLAGQAKGNAEGATRANKMMQDTQKAVEHAGESFQLVVESMNGIRASSDKVSGIIRTIEDVAFQTKMLALNAAVEAARAGEQGKSFAVVAEEVRALAERAGEAAHSTGLLIEESATLTKTGAEVADKAAEGMLQVRESAARVLENVSSIATASNEQSEGIAQISTAVAEMDKITQQVATNSEESASTSEQLNSQANQMTGIVQSLAALVVGNGESNGAATSRSREVKVHQIARNRYGFSTQALPNQKMKTLGSKRSRQDQGLPESYDF